MSASGPLRIAHLTATFPPYPGGAGNTAYRFAREQADRGHHVEVFTAPAPGEAPDPGRVVVHRIKPRFAIGNAPLIPGLARIDGFDVVHIHYPFIFGSELTLLARLRRAGRRQALLVHYKNQLIGKGARGGMFATYERTVAPRLIAAADRVCVLSHDHADSVPYLARLRRSAPERVVVMPNGVDAEVFSPGEDGAGWRGRLGIAADAIVGSFVATLDLAHHFKRVDVAIDALARAKPEVHLIVAGGGDLEDDFRERARAAGVAERTHFLGRIPHHDLPDVLRATDFHLLTTEPPESFGIVLIEAMATGLPAIATDYPGVRAVVDDGVNGMVVPRGDAGAVAAAIDRLVATGPEGRHELGAAGRQKALREWAWDALTERMLDTYRDAIARRTARR